MDMYQKVLQLWLMTAKEGRVSRDDLPSAVYLAVTDTPLPDDAPYFKTAIDLCEYMHQERNGSPMPQHERLSLIQYAVAMGKGSSLSPGLLKALAWIPNLAVVYAILAIIVASFSWSVLTMALFAKLWHGFARHLSSMGHGSASGHIALAILTLLISIGISTIHITTLYRFP